MARYGQKFKERVVARLLPPESSSVETVSQTVGISVTTLERWRAEVLASPAGEAARHWTPVARLEAVIATAAMNQVHYDSRAATCLTLTDTGTATEAGQVEGKRRRGCCSLREKERAASSSGSAEETSWATASSSPVPNILVARVN